MSATPAGPIPDPNAWRALMTRAELEAFDRGDYDELRKASSGSYRISRDNRLVRLTDGVAEHAPAVPTPEDTAQASELAHAADVFRAVPRPCVRCGKHLPGRGERRFVILAMDRVVVYCQLCFEALGVSLEGNDWFATLPALDQRIWHLLKQGLSQPEIAARLTNGSQRVTQQMVSRVKLKISKLIREKRERPKYAQSIQQVEAKLA